MSLREKKENRHYLKHILYKTYYFNKYIHIKHTGAGVWTVWAVVAVDVVLVVGVVVAVPTVVVGVVIVGATVTVCRNRYK